MFSKPQREPLLAVVTVCLFSALARDAENDISIRRRQIHKSVFFTP